MKRFMILITAIAAAYLSMPQAAAAQDFSKDTLWTKNLWPEESYACRFTPDGKYVIATVGKTICKFDALTGNLVSRFKDTCDDVITYMDFSKKLSIILTLDFHQHKLYIWDYNLEKIIKTIDYNIYPLTGINGMAISNDERFILLGRMEQKDNNLVILNLENYNEEIKSVQGKILTISFSPDGKYFVTASLVYDEFHQEQYSHLYLWKTENWEFVQELGYLKGKIINLNYSPDGKFLAFAREVDPLIVWDMEKLIKVQEYSKIKTGQLHYNAKFSPNSKYIVLSSGPPPNNLTTLIWDFINDTLFFKYDFPGSKFNIGPYGNAIVFISNKKLLMISPKWNITGIDNDVIKFKNDVSTMYIKDSIYFEINIVNPGFTTISIFDINGNKVQTFPFKYLAPGHYNFARASSLPTGVYFAVMQCGDNTISQQFEVVR